MAIWITVALGAIGGAAVTAAVQEPSQGQATLGEGVFGDREPFLDNEWETPIGRLRFAPLAAMPRLGAMLDGEIAAVRAAGLRVRLAIVRAADPGGAGRSVGDLRRLRALVADAARGREAPRGDGAPRATKSDVAMEAPSPVAGPRRLP